MNSQQFFAALRALLMAVGSYFIGKMIFGVTIDQMWWESIVGIAMAAAALIWSYFANMETKTVLEGFVRQIITFVGAVFLARGILTKEILESILALLATVLPFLQSYNAKKVF